MKVPQPRSLAQATEQAERYAQLAAELAAIEANRAQALAGTNGVADALAAPLIEERAAILAAMQPWWARAAAKLTDGKRKSIELGGCVIGSRTGAVALAVPGGSDKAALAIAIASPLRAKLTVPKRSLDKKGIRALIEKGGTLAAKIVALGFSLPAGEEEFFLEPIGSDEAKVSAR